ncbi:hypothetical protein M758_7G166900 [Ceratodon purpureus]|nr:hypothetical protein M758_7G166900 [Ceratodon purpureus]
MDGVNLEGDAVIEDGLGPDDEGVGNISPKPEKCPPAEGPDGGNGGGLTPLSRTKSLGYLGSYGRILPMANSLKYADLSEKQKEEIKFPPRTFDYLRDDIRQNLIDLINFKISKEKSDDKFFISAVKPKQVESPKVDESVQTYAIPHFKPPKAALTSSTANCARTLNDDFLRESKPVEVQEIESESKTKSETSPQKEGKKFDSFLLVHNVAKRHNLGTLARSATAFGVTEIILVGRKDFNAFGSHGATLHLQFRHFHTLAEAVKYLKAKDVSICGVEITEGAAGVHKHPFNRSTAFVLGNEGTGLSEKEMEICDSFVYIPQSGPGTASLNVTVAASIVLHQFAVWADFPERERDGQKFVVAERPVRRGPRNMCPDDPVEVAERRRLKAESAAEDWLLCDTLYDASDDATDEAGMGGETE